MAFNVLRPLTIGLAVLGLALAGCGGPKGGGGKRIPEAAPGSRVTESVPGPPTDGDWLVRQIPAEPPHLNPMLATGDYYTQVISSLVYDSLLERDNETLELKPVVAESWEVAPDHLTFTFRLRKDVKFSDGVPLTAHDVKFSFDTIMNPTVDAAELRNYYINVQSCETPDDYTVRYVCKEPYFKSPEMLGGMPILPRHIFGTGDFNRHPNSRHPIGSGMYVMDAWDTNQQVVLSRNEGYWGKKPHLKKYVFKIITDDNAALQLLEQGGLDELEFTSADQWVTRTNHPRFDEKFDRYEYFQPQYGYIGWNLRRPQFEDKRVRQALTRMLDRELILKALYHGYAQAVTNAFFINSEEYNREIKSLPFDPQAARALLDEAGWKDTNGNGLRDKNGQEFRFDFMLPSGNDTAERLATVFKEELARSGIDMTIRRLEWATMTQNVHDRQFDAYIMAWMSGVDQDPYQIWHSSQADKGSNYIGFANAECDRLMEEARREFDRAKRIEMYHRFSEIVYEEQPYTFLFSRKTLVAVDKRFRGVHQYPLGLDHREWWVPTEFQKYR